ncbi:MAG: DUF86 domain-containing protein [Defluviitaleaceae bacterium]|nr:DUF86 domain-containing protein [Defluviitaleaceae bacterium]
MNAKDRRILSRMLEFAYRISRRANGLTYEKFIEDVDIQDAILYALGQLGENANTLSDGFREKYPSEEWHSLIGLRNRLFHSYEDINLDMVFEMAINDIDGVIDLICEITSQGDESS